MSDFSRQVMVRDSNTPFCLMTYFLPDLSSTMPFSQVTRLAGCLVSQSRVTLPFSSARVSLNSLANLLDSEAVHGAHVLDPVDGVAVEAYVVEEPLHVSNHVVQLTGERGVAFLLDFHRLEVFYQLQRTHCN
ncbi:hypothetical protein F7725_027319 [Dissostichus mawsoni]|uniref:Uncharacterized protein n=1 Tax=Dissostichus mawsoni TaxID=36200 RepID=A0A7J5XCT7_DISMA|nr:hypothetical protein F7725_027319 [Dissostichus mawsoni]